MKIVQTDFFQDFRMIAITMAAITIIAPPRYPGGGRWKGGRPEILDNAGLLKKYVHVSDGFGGYLGAGGLAGDHISYHANAQLMGIDPDRLYEGSIFRDFDHLPT